MMETVYSLTMWTFNLVFYFEVVFFPLFFKSVTFESLSVSIYVWKSIKMDCFNKKSLVIHCASSIFVVSIHSLIPPCLGFESLTSTHLATLAPKTITFLYHVVVVVVPIRFCDEM